MATRWRIALGLGLVFAALYVLTGGGRFFSVDEVATYQLTRWLVTGQAIAHSSVTRPGPDGLFWGLQGPVLSVLALPFFGVGELLRQMLPGTWLAALAGPVLARGGVLWGGDMPIFAVSCTNAFVTAAVLATFFWCCELLGASRRYNVLCTVVLGASTLLFAQSKNFFTHSAVALWLLIAVTCLIRARTRPRYAWWAGGATALMMLTRTQASVALLPLGVYVLLVLPERSASWRQRLRRSVPFALPVVLGLLGIAAYNIARFGGVLDTGYGHVAVHWDFDYADSVYGNLLSVGRSVFLYSPPLLLILPGIIPFVRRHRAEAGLIGGLCLVSLVVYSSWGSWYGGWCFGNRFLLPWVPLLMLALPAACDWWLSHSWWRRTAFAVVCGLGTFIQVLGLAINIAFTHYRYHLPDAPRPLPYLFIPSQSQLALHLHSLLNGLDIDFWLARVLRGPGLGVALLLALPCVVIGLGGGLLLRSTRHSSANERAIA